ncbi:spry domain-containing socs box protein [Anaeramoeba flamelloides]|uniref:Spry domain-containing socs box protein n=1 Tax=Anaeramoeba flamelloides TaxID=1746091 RepID=A0ABQ8Z7G4_9EUKA|nr:spry domain-containing socs box protein [Anaeramoeba flamelloides]
MSEADYTDNIEKIEDEFVVTKKGSHIKISQNSKKVRKEDLFEREKGYRCVRGKRVISEKKIYRWEIKVENDNNGKVDVYLGICPRDAIKEEAIVIGYLYDAKFGVKISTTQRSRTNYGLVCNSGDIVGILVNKIDNTLTFERNGKSMGVAFSNLPSVDFVLLVELWCNSSDITIM